MVGETGVGGQGRHGEQVLHSDLTGTLYPLSSGQWVRRHWHNAGTNKPLATMCICNEFFVHVGSLHILLEFTNQYII